MMDDSPNDPGVSNAWDSSDARGAHGKAQQLEDSDAPKLHRR